MGSWRKMGAFLGLVPEEDGRRDEYGDEYGEPDGYHPDSYRDDYPPHQGDADFAEDEPARGHGSYPSPSTQGSLAVQSRRDESVGAIRPVTVKLTGFSEARVIGEKFRDGKPVILDMTEMDDAGARRLVDFAAGLAFALRGSIDKVTTKVFMLLPPDTDVADIPSYEPAPTAFTGGFADVTGRERGVAAGMRAHR